MTHGGPFQPQTFCDSVIPRCCCSKEWDRSGDRVFSLSQSMCQVAGAGGIQKTYFLVKIRSRAWSCTLRVALWLPWASTGSSVHLQSLASVAFAASPHPKQRDLWRTAGEKLFFLGKFTSQARRQHAFKDGTSWLSTAEAPWLATSKSGWLFLLDLLWVTDVGMGWEWAPLSMGP